MIDLTFRARSRDRWIAWATEQGMYDDQGNPKECFAIDEIGSIALTDAVMDADNKVVTPAVMDDWFVVNVRIYGKKFNEDLGDVFDAEEDGKTRFSRSKIVKGIKAGANKVNIDCRGEKVRAFQLGTGKDRVQLIAPIAAAKFAPRVWFGEQEQ